MKETNVVNCTRRFCLDTVVAPSTTMGLLLMLDSDDFASVVNLFESGTVADETLDFGGLYASLTASLIASPTTDDNISTSLIWHLSVSLTALSIEIACELGAPNVPR
ncbi:unnamed protein product [Schistosoma margrebowiei]|uniref:Uncharacterized protein n=1 Tax=Schistosoma margrebowiei TaxID=48269 RepID=A0A3P8C7W4_9TREM|nr:unnamed protein product [Schistosoma margrebowiei]